jgi:hypothetical protein
LCTHDTEWRQTKQIYLKWQWIFYFFVDLFHSLSLARLLPSWLYTCVTRGVYYKKQELPTLNQQLGSPRFLCGPCGSSFCVVLFVLFVCRMFVEITSA